MKKRTQLFRKQSHKYLALSLVTALIMVQPMALFAQEVTGNKDETVYMSLQSNGRLDKTTVVNTFETSDAKIIDYGLYENLVNLTSNDAPVITDDMVTFERSDVSQKRFYYQGDLVGATNPWVIDIAYTLDGKPVEAEALAGQSGHMTITVDVKRNPLSKVDFASTYTLQMTAVLGAEVSSNLTVEGASVVTVGSNQQVVITVLPKQEKHVVIEADIEAFKMEAITAVGTLSNIDMDIDTTEIAEGFEALLDGSNELLAGMNQYKDGLTQSAEAVSAFKLNLDKLDGGKNVHKQGAAQLSKG